MTLQKDEASYSEYESELLEARQKALDEMAQRARSMGANAVVGIDIDYEVLGADNGMLMVTASGPAVIIDSSWNMPFYMPLPSGAGIRVNLISK